METFEANASLNFESISLANPQPVQGGSFFTRATLDNDTPIYIQLPKCYTKNGIIQTKRGKYSDLLYFKLISSLEVGPNLTSPIDFHALFSSIFNAFISFGNIEKLPSMAFSSLKSTKCFSMKEAP